MEIQLDLAKEYGIVLEGGGARGAYQIGAWKALQEAGVKIRGIAGTSVGALNGALMCMDDLTTALRIWENISYSQVIYMDEGLIEQIRERKIKDLDLGLLASSGRQLIKDKGLDITPLKELIDRTVDEEKIRNSPRELFISAMSLTDRKPVVVNARAIEPGKIGSMLLASAYLPAFKPEKLDGKRYLDGAFANNVPIDVLLEQGYCDLIVIRIYGMGVDTEKKIKIPEPVEVRHIAPRRSLGGVLEFDRKKTRRNLLLGYLDGKRMLYGLAGRKYYIYAPEDESFYFAKMMSMLALLLPGEAVPAAGCRGYTETVFPRLAKQMKLGKDWNYKDLYIGLLEQAAGNKKLPYTEVYTEEQLAWACGLGGR